MRLLKIFVVCGFASFSACTLWAQAEKDELLGKFNPAMRQDFMAINDSDWFGGSTNRYLRKEVYQAFRRMSDAAKAEGISLRILSATRNFDAQKQIWEKKWTGKIKVEGKDLRQVTDKKKRALAILRYSAMPGVSRHHWGTDIDLNAFENQYFEQGEGLRIYRWLCEHAPQYGFCQPYTDKSTGRTGYEEEKWHWSYLPKASQLFREYIKLIHPADIRGFLGSETVQYLRIIETYVSDVDCR